MRPISALLEIKRITIVIIFMCAKETFKIFACRYFFFNQPRPFIWVLKPICSVTPLNLPILCMMQPIVSSKIWRHALLFQMKISPRILAINLLWFNSSCDLVLCVIFAYSYGYLRSEAGHKAYHTTSLFIWDKPIIFLTESVLADPSHFSRLLKSPRSCVSSWICYRSIIECLFYISAHISHYLVHNYEWLPKSRCINFDTWGCLSLVIILSIYHQVHSCYHVSVLKVSLNIRDFCFSKCHLFSSWLN